MSRSGGPFSSAEVAFALAAVQQAARLTRLVQQEMVSPAMTKEDRSPVTVGDFAAQAVVARLLEQTFPDDPLVAEENAAALRDAGGEATLAQVTAFMGRQVEGATPGGICDWIDRGTAEPAKRFWTLDPIDGTKGFLRREQYAVALALLENGIVRIGVLGCPDLTVEGEQEVGGPGSLAVAVRGEGAWAAPLDVPALTADQFVELRVSGRRTLHQARMLRSVEAVHTHGGKIEELAEQLGIEAEPIRMDSQAKYSVLAAGGADLLVRLLSPSRPDYRETIWDHAAGSLIVEQAGGRVTDLDGKPLDFTAGRRLMRNRGLVASNRDLHDAILAGLASVGA